MLGFSWKTAAATLALAFVGATQAHADLITNGTFTTAGLPSLAGWTASSSGIGTSSESGFSICCGGTNARANNLAQFGGGGTSNGTLSQTFATVVGQLYNLSFMYGTFGDNETQSLAVTVGNLTTSVSDPTGTSNFSNLFNAESFTFTATAAISTLLFRDTSTSGSSADGLLESVSATAVPEPSSVGVLGLGLIAATFLATRRRGANAAV